MARQPSAARTGRAANRTRGEHSLTLGGREYLLRPSMEAVCAIEEALDLSASQIVAKANASSLRLTELAAIVTELVRAGAAEDDDLTKSVSAAGMEPLLHEKGVAGLYPFLTLLFIEVITGGRDREGNAVAVTATKATAPKTAAPATAT